MQATATSAAGAVRFRPLVAALALVALAAAGIAWTTGWSRASDSGAAELRLDISTPRTVAPHEFALSPDGRASWPVLSAVERLTCGFANSTRPRRDRSKAAHFPSGRRTVVPLDISVAAVKRVDLIDGKMQTLAAVEIGRGGIGAATARSCLGCLAALSCGLQEGGEARAATRGRSDRPHVPAVHSDNRHFVYLVVGTRIEQASTGNARGCGYPHRGRGPAAAVLSATVSSSTRRA